MSIHADDRAYKPLNWMNPPCSLREESYEENGAIAKWTVTHGKSGERLILTIAEILHDTSHELGIDPACRRTASRRTSRSCSPSTSPRSGTATR